MNAKMSTMQITSHERPTALFVSVTGESKRVQKVRLELDSHGVVGDKFYGKDTLRSLLITSVESYQLAAQHNIAMAYGDLGENILLNLNPYHLSVGTRVLIGEVLLEISQSCTICKSLSRIDSKLPKLLKADRGIFAKVIRGGVITEDSVVSIVQEQRGGA